MTDAEIAQVPQRVREEDRQRRRLLRTEESISDEEEEDNEVNWKDQLLAALLSMPPAGFERLYQRILRESGFTKVEVTGRVGDGGIDGTGVLRLNLLSFHVLFQSKRFRGAMVGRADKGLIMTTGTFTPEARRESTRDGAPAIDLVDGDALCDLIKDLKIGIAIRLVEDVQVDSEFFQSL